MSRIYINFIIVLKGFVGRFTFIYYHFLLVFSYFDFCVFYVVATLEPSSSKRNCQLVVVVDCGDVDDR